jgi:hypothetical protein
LGNRTQLPSSLVKELAAAIARSTARTVAPPINGGVARRVALARNYFPANRASVRRMQKKDFGGLVFLVLRATDI